jgi:hypothetical protein
MQNSISIKIKDLLKFKENKTLFINLCKKRYSDVDIKDYVRVFIKILETEDTITCASIWEKTKNKKMVMNFMQADILFNKEMLIHKS